jgi:hypothetical protein
MFARRLTSGIAVAAYLLATTASSLLHDHGPHGAQEHGCHLHGSRLHGDHAHRHGPHDHHAHHHAHDVQCAASHTSHSEQELPAPLHDHDCPACQFVGQLSLPVTMVGHVLSRGIVTEIREIAPTSWFDISLDCPRSRGPPA